MLHELQESVPKDWLSIVEKTKSILDELPIDKDSQLLELYKQVAVPWQDRDQKRSLVDQLRWLLIRLSESWMRCCVFDWQSEVLWTNNGTEYMIDKMKMRSQTV